ncbi:MAG: hypothetical protein MJ071_00085 [Oscillospiraceae bacterium]|nr:hypothetical protein [Oscillospiraceae bacterium]
MSMFTMKFNEDEMLTMLNELLLDYDETVEAAVYCSFKDTGFFASSRHLMTGYLGITNRNRIVGYCCDMLTKKPIQIEMNNITKIKVSGGLFGQKNVYVEHFSDRLYKMKATLIPKVYGRKFPNQRENFTTLLDVFTEKQRQLQP